MDAFGALRPLGPPTSIRGGRLRPLNDTKESGTLKKLYSAVLLGALTALVVAASASSAVAPTLTLGIAPNHVLIGQTVTLSGKYAAGGAGIPAAAVTISRYDNASCSGGPSASQGFVTNGSGDYSFSGAVGLPNGVYSFRSVAGVTSSPCVLLTVGVVAAVDPVPQTDHMYLCYSKWEQDGGMVVDAKDAAADMKSGLWAPSAIKGNLPDGPGVENMGAYHLSCNPDPSLKPTGGYIDNIGEQFDAAYAASTGFVGVYPVVA